jgi:hypothetical protein
MEATEEMIGYRPVSRLAVAAAVAGGLSSLALTTPLLWILPLVGVVLAVAGLADVARVGAEKAGRTAALVGLALSVGFGAQAMTTTAMSRWIMESRTKAAARAWLDAVREDRLADAGSMIAPHLLPLSQSEDHSHGSPGHPDDHKHGGGPPPSIDGMPAVKAILGCGTAAVVDVRYAGRDAETGEGWCARVRLAPCGNGGAVELLLELRPAVVTGTTRREERWTIFKIDLVP